MREAEKVTQATRLYGMQPYVQDYVNRKIHIIEMRVFLLSDKGDLTPEAALAAWMEVKALRRFLNTVQQDINAGTTAAERMPAPELQPKE